MNSDVNSGKYHKAVIIIIIIIIAAIIILFSYLNHVGKCLHHGIITRERSVWRQNRKAFDACVIKSVNFCSSIQGFLLG